MRVVAASLVIAGLAACGFDPHPNNGALPCDNGCPPGYVCGTDNRCWQGVGPDAGTGGTAGPVGTGGASTSRLDAPVVGTGGATSNGGTVRADAPTTGTGGTIASTGGKAQTGGTTSRSGGNSGSGGSHAGSGGSTVPGSCPVDPGPNSGAVNFCNGRAQGAMTGFSYAALGRDDTLTDPKCAPDASNPSKTQAITVANLCLSPGLTMWSRPDALCMSGSIPMVTGGDYANNWGLQVGVNTVEPPATRAGNGTLGKSYSTITINTSGTISPTNNAIRVLIHLVGMTADANPYCATMRASGEPMDLTAFNTACWDGSGTNLAAADIPNIDKIALQVSSDITSAFTVDNFCLVSILFDTAAADGGVDAPMRPDGGRDAGVVDVRSVTTDPLVWVTVQDTEPKACATNGPGVDIDAVALISAAGTPLGYGKIGTGVFTINPAGNACENIDCSGGNCKYAWNGTTFLAETLVSWTEGAPDAFVLAVGDDAGYFALNAGTLQIQIGDVSGLGAAKQLKSGDYIQVFELDKGYIASGSAPPTCACLPEHYTVSLQSQSGAQFIPLSPVVIDTANNTTCEPLTTLTLSAQGCGTTMFRVP